MSTVIGSGRAATEAVAWFGVAWRLAQRAADSSALTLPEVEALAPQMLGIDEHRYRSVQVVATGLSAECRTHGRRGRSTDPV